MRGQPVNRHAKGTPYRRPRRTPLLGGLCPGVVGGRWWCSGADGAVGKWPVGATVRRVRRRRAPYPQRRREVVELRCRAQARCLKRQLSLPVSTMSQWWVRRPSAAGYPGDGRQTPRSHLWGGGGSRYVRAFGEDGCGRGIWPATFRRGRPDHSARVSSRCRAKAASCSVTSTVGDVVGFSLRMRGA